MENRKSRLGRRRLVFVLANPEVNESLSPSLARRLRRLLLGEET